MMYQNKLVLAIKVGGKILREFGDTVYIPFGAEYTLLVKNLNSVRVKFRVHIDGTDTTDATWIVIPPYGQVELERFIKDGNFSSGRRFRFIERTSDIEDHRGIKAEDGLVRIEFQTELIIPPIQVYYGPNNWPTWTNEWNKNTYGAVSGSLTPAERGVTRSRGITGQSVANSQVGNFYNSYTPTGSLTGASASLDIAPNDAGITVAGSQSQQKFYSTYDFPTTGTTDVIVLKLKGGDGPKVVAAPVFVVTKATCPTCGKRSKSSYEFCPKCGTALRDS